MSGFLLGILGGFLGAMLGVVGAEFAKFALAPGKHQEERRDRIVSDMFSSLDTIEDLGTRYWNGEFAANSETIRTAEQTIRAEIHNLLRDSGDLFFNEKNARKLCDDEVKSLRMLVTGGDFGDGQQLIDSTIMLQVRTKSGDARRMIRNQRAKLKRRFI